MPALLLILCFLTASAADQAKPYEATTDAEIVAITFDDVAKDDGWVAPVCANLDHLKKARAEEFAAWKAKLDAWPAGKSDDALGKTAALIDLAALADLGRSEWEGEVAYAVFEKLKAEVPAETLKKTTAYMALHPDRCPVTTSAEELDITGTIAEEKVRKRSVIFAKKLLGRVVGKLPKDD
jgi:hypothetical protein